MILFRRIIHVLFIFLLPSLICLSCKEKMPEAKSENLKEEIVAPKGMVWIPGGGFTRGAQIPGEYEREYPPHQVQVAGFFMDSIEVTNAQFQTFVHASKYITIAEKVIDWEEMRQQLPPGIPKPADSLLAAGSLVFSPPESPVSLDNHTQWWMWKTGINWKNANGDESSFEKIPNHPVVHIAYADAQAYCQWRGGSLPTEAEWEYAAKGGLNHARFSWGEEDPLVNPNLANIWQGNFPIENTALDGFAGTAPVASFAPNGYGLYDMAGNVWEWCSDLFDENHYRELAGYKLCHNPSGPKRSFDSREPHAGNKRVIKGGSYLCHVSYCENYRPTAREATSEDSGMPHLGFRCVIRPEVVPGE